MNTTTTPSDPRVSYALENLNLILAKLRAGIAEASYATAARMGLQLDLQYRVQIENSIDQQMKNLHALARQGVIVGLYYGTAPDPAAAPPVPTLSTGQQDIVLDALREPAAVREPLYKGYVFERFVPVGPPTMHYVATDVAVDAEQPRIETDAPGASLIVKP